MFDTAFSSFTFPPRPSFLARSRLARSWFERSFFRRKFCFDIFSVPCRGLHLSVNIITTTINHPPPTNHNTVNPNGVLTFGSGSTLFSACAIAPSAASPATCAPTLAIFGFWTDLFPGDSSCFITTGTVRSARCCVE